MDYWRESLYFSYNSEQDTNTKTKPQTPESRPEMLTTIGKATEIKLDLPKVFTGKQMGLNKFI